MYLQEKVLAALFHSARKFVAANLTSTFLRVVYLPKIGQLKNKLDRGALAGLSSRQSVRLHCTGIFDYLTPTENSKYCYLNFHVKTTIFLWFGWKFFCRSYFCFLLQKS